MTRKKTLCYGKRKRINTENEYYQTPTINNIKPHKCFLKQGRVYYIYYDNEIVSNKTKVEMREILYNHYQSVLRKKENDLMKINIEYTTLFIQEIRADKIKRILNN